MADYISEPQQRLLTVLHALAGHELEGITVTQISQQTGLTTATVTRALRNLEAQGFAEQAGERWRHGAAVLTMYRMYASSLKTTLTAVLDTAMQVIN